MIQGDPIKGIVHSTDASAGVEIPIYNQGTTTARTLKSYEYIEIHSVVAVSVPGGDLRVILSADATLDTGETVIRGTVTPNGGIVQSKLLSTGVNGAKAFVIAPAGVVDVEFNGVVRNGTTPGVRPDWKESLIPGA